MSLATSRQEQTQSRGEPSSASGDSDGCSRRGIVIASAQLEERDIKLLRSQIKMNEAFNGIKFNSVEWEVTHTGKNIDSVFIITSVTFQ